MTVAEPAATAVHKATWKKVREVVPEWAEQRIRQDERERLAALVGKHADTIASFANDPGRTVKLVAFMLALKGGD